MSEKTQQETLSSPAARRSFFWALQGFQLPVMQVHISDVLRCGPFLYHRILKSTLDW